MDYLKMVMEQLATIVHNTSQSNSEWHSKDRILDSIKGIVEDYNRVVSEKNQVTVKDFRKR